MQRPLKVILERLRSSDPLVREAAIRELATSNDPGAVAALKQVYESEPDQNLKELVKQTALQIQANAKQRGWATSAGNGGQGAPAQSGEQVYQMLWDCRFCSTTKLLGVEHRHCPNCGAAQDPAWRYFPSDEDLRVVKDPHYQYAGVDKICPFCGQPNSAAANFCKDCGGDLTNAKAATTKDALHTGLDGAAGVRDDVVLQKFKAEQQAIRAPRKGGLTRLHVILIAIVALCLLGVGAYVVLSRSTYSSSVAVTDQSWQRIITVERLEAQPGNGWRDEVPDDAYNRSCHSQDRCHTESEQYVCGSVNVDRGDGSFTRKDKYCNRDKTACVLDQKCNYTVNRWRSLPDLVTSGGPSEALIWPNFSPSGATALGAVRESGRREVLIVVFKDANGNTFPYNPKDYPTWQAFKVGQRYTVDINRLNQVQWNTLQLTSSQ
jgi:hypothetical protein